MKILRIIKYAWQNDSDFRLYILITGVTLFVIGSNLFVWAHYTWPFKIDVPFLRWLCQIFLLVCTSVLSWFLILGIVAGIGVLLEEVNKEYDRIKYNFDASEAERKRKAEQIERERLQQEPVKQALNSIYSAAHKPASPDEIAKDPTLATPHVPGINIF